MKNGKFYYEMIGDSTIELTGIKEAYMNEIESIPGRIDGMKVARIGPKFALNPLITTLLIPDSVALIASGAFQGNEFTSVCIGAGLKDLNPINTFSKLKRVFIAKENPYFEIIGDNLYRKSTKSLELYLEGEIHPECKKISSYAACNRTFQSMIIPKNVVEIEALALNNSIVQRLIISDNVFQIQQFGVARCTIDELQFENDGDGDCKVETKGIWECQINSITIDGAIEFAELAICLCVCKSMSILRAFFANDSISHSFLLMEPEVLKNIEVDFKHLTPLKKGTDVAASIKSWLGLKVSPTCTYYKGRKVSGEWRECRYW